MSETGIRGLASAIILQALLDRDSKEFRNDVARFFLSGWYAQLATWLDIDEKGLDPRTVKPSGPHLPARWQQRVFAGKGGGERYRVSVELRDLRALSEGEISFRRLARKYAVRPEAIARAYDDWLSD